jgi:hypothetical protein
VRQCFKKRSPIELPRDLNGSTWEGVRDLTKTRCATRTSIRVATRIPRVGSVELRVVEGVEQFRPEL